MNSFSHANLTFDVLEVGPSDGEVVVLLHGFPQTNQSLVGIANRLAASGYRVLAPNQRGYSPGARVRGRRNYRLPEVVGDVAALVRTASDRPVHVVGHDFGASVAWMLAAHQPELVQTLTAISVPHPGAHRRALRTSIQGLRSWYMLALQLPAIPERLLGLPGMVERFMTGSGQSSADAKRDAAAISGHEGGPINWYRGLSLTPAAYQEVHATRPTLQIWGTADPFVARTSIDHNPHFVDAPYHLEIFNDAGHWIPDQLPDRAAQRILAHLAAYSGSVGTTSSARAHTLFKMPITA